MEGLRDEHLKVSLRQNILAQLQANFKEVRTAVLAWKPEIYEENNCNLIRPDGPPRQPHPSCEESLSDTETKLRSVVLEQGKLLKTQSELLKCHSETFKKVTSAFEEHEHEEFSKRSTHVRLDASSTMHKSHPKDDKSVHSVQVSV